MTNYFSSIDSAKTCFDPIIPTTQYIIYGTQNTNSIQDLNVVVMAGLIEDTNYGRSYNIQESSFTKAAIKESSKLFCKNLSATIGIKKAHSTFICELTGLMSVEAAKNAFSIKNFYKVNYDFITNQFPKLVLESLIKVPASMAKDYINYSFKFEGANLLAEYVHRIIGNTGKHLITTHNQEFDDSSSYYIQEHMNQTIGNTEYCPLDYYYTATYP